MSSERLKVPLRREPSAVRELRKLGRNINGYFGETIDIAVVLSDCVQAARSHGWRLEEIPVTAELKLVALTRHAGPRAPHPSGLRHPEPITPRARVYMSTGIHGDEPAGPLAVRQLLQENLWPADLDLWLCPCLNPTGFLLNRRENAQGKDLNRDYRDPQAPETRAHLAWLHRQPRFDLTLCLHEDWESHGFYVYELNPEQRPTLAEAIVQGVAAVCPIDSSELIEGRPANRGVIRPSVDPRARPDWPEAFFLLTHKTPVSYTLEAPSDFPLHARVAALAAGVRTALGLVATRAR